MAFTTRFIFNTVINNTELDLHFISKIFQHFIHSGILSKYIARGSPALSNCECYKVGDNLDPILRNFFVWRITKVSVFNILLSIRKFLMSFFLSKPNRFHDRQSNYLLFIDQGSKRGMNENMKFSNFDIPENGVINLAFNDLKIPGNSHEYFISACITNIFKSLRFWPVLELILS